MARQFLPREAARKDSRPEDASRTVRILIGCDLEEEAKRAPPTYGRAASNGQLDDAQRARIARGIINAGRVRRGEPPLDDDDDDDGVVDFGSYYRRDH